MNLSSRFRGLQSLKSVCYLFLPKLAHIKTKTNAPTAFPLNFHIPCMSRDYSCLHPFSPAKPRTTHDTFLPLISILLVKRAIVYLQDSLVCTCQGSARSARSGVCKTNGARRHREVFDTSRGWKRLTIHMNWKVLAPESTGQPVSFYAPLCVHVAADASKISSLFPSRRRRRLLDGNIYTFFPADKTLLVLVHDKMASRVEEILSRMFNRGPTLLFNL